MSNHWKEEEFIEYLDRRAAPAVRARLEAHLAECADCRGRVEELQSLRTVLDEWTPAAVSPSFEARLRAQLAEETRAPRGWFALRPAFALGLAAVAALAVAVMLWRSPESEVVQVEPQQPSVAAPAAVASTEESLSAGVASPPSESETLAALENPVLLSDYELLEEFDILFEPLEKENGKSL
jgi:anti-sigma factor RsiW